MDGGWQQQGARTPNEKQWQVGKRRQRGCGKAELLCIGWQWQGARSCGGGWHGGAQGRRPNAKFGDWRSEKPVAAGEAAAAGAAGRPSCCGWRKAMAGLSGSER